jgi:hypothetical protein
MFPFVVAVLSTVLNVMTCDWWANTNVTDTTSCWNWNSMAEFTDPARCKFLSVLQITLMNIVSILRSSPLPTTFSVPPQAKLQLNVKMSEMLLSHKVGLVTREIHQTYSSFWGKFLTRPIPYVYATSPAARTKFVRKYSTYVSLLYVDQIPFFIL